MAGASPAASLAEGMAGCSACTEAGARGVAGGEEENAGDGNAAAAGDSGDAVRCTVAVSAVVEEAAAVVGEDGDGDGGENPPSPSAGSAFRA